MNVNLDIHKAEFRLYALDIPDGYELARRLKEGPEGKRINFIRNVYPDSELPGLRNTIANGGLCDVLEVLPQPERKAFLERLYPDRELYHAENFSKESYILKAVLILLEADKGSFLTRMYPGSEGISKLREIIDGSDLLIEILESVNIGRRLEFLKALYSDGNLAKLKELIWRSSQLCYLLKQLPETDRLGVLKWLYPAGDIIILRNLPHEPLKEILSDLPESERLAFIDWVYPKIFASFLGSIFGAHIREYTELLPQSERLRFLSRAPFKPHVLFLVVDVFPLEKRWGIFRLVLADPEVEGFKYYSPFDRLLQLFELTAQAERMDLLKSCPDHELPFLRDQIDTQAKLSRLLELFLDEETLSFLSYLYPDGTLPQILIGNIYDFIKAVPERKRTHYLNWLYPEHLFPELLQLMGYKYKIYRFLSLFPMQERAALFKQFFNDSRFKNLKEAVNDIFLVMTVLSLLPPEQRIGLLLKLFPNNELEHLKEMICSGMAKNVFYLNSINQSNDVGFIAYAEGTIPAQLIPQNNTRPGSQALRGADNINYLVLMGADNTIYLVYNQQAIVIPFPFEAKDAAIVRIGTLKPGDLASSNFNIFLKLFPETERLRVLTKLFPPLLSDLRVCIEPAKPFWCSSIFECLPEKDMPIFLEYAYSPDELNEALKALSFEGVTELIRRYPSLYKLIYQFVYAHDYPHTFKLSFKQSMPLEAFLSAATFYSAYAEGEYGRQFASPDFDPIRFRIGLRKVLLALNALDFTRPEEDLNAKAQLVQHICWLAKFHLYPFAEVLFGDEVDTRKISYEDAGFYSSVFAASSSHAAVAFDLAP